MLNVIGDIAGKVWAYLNENGETSLTSLKKNLELKPDEAGYSLGWLAREGKIRFQKKGTSIKVSLIK